MRDVSPDGCFKCGHDEVASARRARCGSRRPESWAVVDRLVRSHADPIGVSRVGESSCMNGVRSRAGRWWARLVGVLVGCVACAPVGVAFAVDWSRVHQLVSARVRTFSPELAVDGDGFAAAAWFAGPGPPVSAEGMPFAGSLAWTGQRIVVSLGSITHGLGKPKLLAGDGSDVEGQIKVAVSGSGITYVAWPTADFRELMIATGEAGKMSKPRVLPLPRGAQLQRLANGLTGPVDAFYLRSGRYYCTRLGKHGTPGATTIARHPFEANPCHLSGTNVMNPATPAQLHQPAGFELPSYALKSKTDGHGDAMAIWDDWPTSGPAWTYGLFYVIHRSSSGR
jgi:hypothetical protein